MSVAVTFNGTQYLIPTTGETGWDTTVTNFLTDVGNNALTLTGTQTVSNKTVRVAAGTAAAPSLSFAADAASGIYQPSASQVAISTAGTQRLLVDASGNITLADNLSVAGTLTVTGNATVSGTLTATAPTAAQNTNTTQIATTAFVIGQASSTTPNMDGSAATGTATTFARADHVHPSDTSRAALAGSSSQVFNVAAGTTGNEAINYTQMHGATGGQISGASGTTSGTVYITSTNFTAATAGVLIAVGSWNSNAGTSPGQAQMEWVLDSTVLLYDTPNAPSWILTGFTTVAAGSHTLSMKTTPYTTLTAGFQMRGGWIFIPTV